MTVVPLHRSGSTAQAFLAFFTEGYGRWIILYLVLINLVAFLVYGADKRAAKAGRRRVPEKTLLGLAAAGGAVGALLGMRAFRHKTKKPAFTVGVPLLLAAHVVLIAVAVWKVRNG